MGRLREVRGWLSTPGALAGWLGWGISRAHSSRTANLSGGNLSRLFPRARTYIGRIKQLNSAPSLTVLQLTSKGVYLKDPDARKPPINYYSIFKSIFLQIYLTTWRKFEYIIIIYISFVIHLRVRLWVEIISDRCLGQYWKGVLVLCRVIALDIHVSNFQASTEGYSSRARGEPLL